MGKSVSPFLKFLAIIVVILLIIGLPLALLAWDVGRVVFNPPLVKNILTDEVVNSDLIPVALEWFSMDVARDRVERGEAPTWISEPDIVALMSLMDKDDWRAAKQEVLTEPILSEWVSVTVDGVYAWIDSAERTPQITWEMQAFKEQVDSEHGVKCIAIAYNNLAPCTQPEIDDFTTRLGQAAPGSDVLYNLCEFPDPWHEDQYNDYLSSLKNLVEEVPLQLPLTNELAAVQDTGGVGPEVLKQQLRTIRTWMTWAWLIPLVLLLLILLLAVRSLKDLARWWGLPLLVGGLAALVPPLVHRGLLTSLMSAGALSEAPPLVIQEATRSILRLAAAAFQPMLIQAVVLVLVGLGLLVWLAWSNKKAAAPQNTTPSKGEQR